MKFKAITKVVFPKFDIDVKASQEFEMTPEQYEEVKIFEKTRFEIAKKKVAKKTKTITEEK